MFERYGVRLPRATQAAWMIALTVVLQPLLNLMDERLRSSGYVRIDETRVQVPEQRQAPSALHWMWVRVAGPKNQRIILFGYDPSRRRRGRRRRSSRVAAAICKAMAIRLTRA